MPALILEGVDLVALFGVYILIGLLAITAFTFARLAVAIDVNIAGLHPFRGISSAIESTIVAGCNKGIEALGQIAHDLWVGLKWSITEMAEAIIKLSNATHDALDWVIKHSISDVVKPLIKVVSDSVDTLRTDYNAFKKAINGDVQTLQTTVTGLPAAVLKTADEHIVGAVGTLRTDVLTDFKTLRGDIARDIGTAETAAEKAGTTAVNQLRTDVTTNLNNAITNVHTDLSTAAGILEGEIGGLGKDIGATAESLRDFIGKVPLTDIVALIAAVPILATAVAVLEAETGLGKAECRRKVSRLCTTDESLFNLLLDGLVLVGVGIGLRDIIEAVVSVAETFAQPIEDFVRG